MLLPIHGYRSRSRHITFMICVLVRAVLFDSSSRRQQSTIRLKSLSLKKRPFVLSLVSRTVIVSIDLSRRYMLPRIVRYSSFSL